MRHGHASRGTAAGPVRHTTAPAPQGHAEERTTLSTHRRSRPPPGGPRQQEAVISASKLASWAFAEEFVAEDEVLMRARDRAAELGTAAVGAGVGAALRVLAAALHAKAVVEIGTGTGVSGLWLLRGMPEDGVLTTIDVEAEHQRAARQTFAEAEIRPGRARVITGRGLDVLPRLTDGAYDLVLVDADRQDVEAYLEQALRLLRSGGVLAVVGALWHDKVADPAQRDETTTAIRRLAKRIQAHEDLLPALLPCGDGLLVAVTR